MHICFLVDRPLGDPKSPEMNAAARDLQRRGYKVSSVLFSELYLDLGRIAVTADLYISKASTELQISLAGILHDRGARLLNTWASSSYVRDKARVTAALMAAGVPVPPSCLASDSRRAALELGRERVIVKPVRGTSGRGIEIVSTPADHDRLPRGPHFVQVYDRLSNDDLKVYVVGREVSIVRRSFPATTVEEKLGRPHADPLIEAIGRKVGDLFGLELYGLDVVETSAGPVVVDVNACPGFVGAPDAGRRVAAYIDLAMSGRSTPVQHGQLVAAAE
ncbi:MAG: ATP-grasp domain-containing protein [Hyphomicrobium sp.]